MHWLFVAARFFPYWAFPIALVLVETGIYFKRWERWKPQILCWGVALFFVFAIGSWIFYRGDLHSDQWIRVLVGNPY